MRTADRLGLGLGAYVLAAPLLVRRGGPTFCPYRRWTGHPCPFCGMTRSVARLTALDPRGAVAAHPLGPGLVILAVLLIARTVSDAWSATQPLSPSSMCV